jgi:hypothetical protein
MVQRRIEPPGQLYHGTGALDIGGALVILPGRDVVDRGAVHHVIDGAEFGDGIGTQPDQPR